MTALRKSVMIKTAGSRTGEKRLKNPNHTDHDIIEYLISLVEHSGDKDGNLYTMGMEGDESNLLTEEQSLQTARYLKKFVDRMPGGFFAYYADEEEELIYANEAMIRLFNCDTMEEFRRYTGNSFRELCIRMIGKKWNRASGSR